MAPKWFSRHAFGVREHGGCKNVNRFAIVTSAHAEGVAAKRDDVQSSS
jgi:hypothetical protein